MKLDFVVQYRNTRKEFNTCSAHNTTLSIKIFIVIVNFLYDLLSQTNNRIFPLALPSGSAQQHTTHVLSFHKELTNSLVASFYIFRVWFIKYRFKSTVLSLICVFLSLEYNVPVAWNFSILKQNYTFHWWIMESCVWFPGKCLKVKVDIYILYILSNLISCQWYDFKSIR